MNEVNDLARVALAAADDGGGFSIGTLLMYIGGAILLAFFCSLGLIARIRDRRVEQRRVSAASRSRSDSADVTHQLPDPEGHDHGQRSADQDAHHRPESS
ncbi:hypothetical protein SAMN04515671_1070 [Nakamurella panacisegetis]|uniref:Uncharacterized protein n=1 Tax=Nakamurella panacisegetis TaxID=1090615 RepID=A0A1H0JX15_9ACTN|nr:hypothetical protein SAMN04515671_1070 [Nakamurella panacisegetis]